MNSFILKHQRKTNKSIETYNQYLSYNETIFVMIREMPIIPMQYSVVREGGAKLRAEIEVDSEGIITDAKFKTYGCGSAIASSSLLTEWVKGRHIDSAELIKNTQIAEELALPPVKIHCSVLAEDAIKAAVKDLRSKRLALLPSTHQLKKNS